jgi:hypothetical protein
MDSDIGRVAGTCVIAVDDEEPLLWLSPEPLSQACLTHEKVALHKIRLLP